MLKLFNNETELGKLYINYPMVESYYHLIKLPDSDYNNRMISLNGLTGKKYKRLVNKVSCFKKNQIGNLQLCHIIMHNYNKCKIIEANNERSVNYEYILDKQIQMKNANNEIYVLSTFPLIVIDYNYEKTMQILKNRLKENFIGLE